MTDERPTDRTEAAQAEREAGAGGDRAESGVQYPPDAKGLRDVDPGAFIGRGSELTRPDIPTSSGDVAPTIPDPGWSPTPGGHREGAPADDDEVKRKG